MKRVTMSLAACAMIALVGACESTPKSETASAPVNAKCPVGGEAADGTVTTSYDGKTVAFCCKSCTSKWNAMSDTEKSTALAKAK